MQNSPRLPPIGGTETITHRRKHEFIIAPRLSKPVAAAVRRFFPAARIGGEQHTEYKDDDLRLSPFAQRIDFTGFHERAQ